MEGRTIVRPGSAGSSKSPAGPPRFNGGPDNCPARPLLKSDIAFDELELQWRAGQLSGQAGHEISIVPPRVMSFNGGPDNCPARPVQDDATPPTLILLQWRAGQLSGQAFLCASLPQRETALQWRAGQLSGQAPGATWLCVDCISASMEGRTIVRPGGTVVCESCRPTCSFNGGPDNCPARRRSPPAPVGLR